MMWKWPNQLWLTRSYWWKLKGSWKLETHYPRFYDLPNCTCEMQTVTASDLAKRFLLIVPMLRWIAESFQQNGGCVSLNSQSLSTNSQGRVKAVQLFDKRSGSPPVNSRSLPTSGLDKQWSPQTLSPPTNSFEAFKQMSGKPPVTGKVFKKLHGKKIFRENYFHVDCQSTCCWLTGKWLPTDNQLVRKKNDYSSGVLPSIACTIIFLIIKFYIRTPNQSQFHH